MHDQDELAERIAFEPIVPQPRDSRRAITAANGRKKERARLNPGIDFYRAGRAAA